jgi:hypothetical protein
MTFDGSAMESGTRNHEFRHCDGLIRGLAGWCSNGGRHMLIWQRWLMWMGCIGGLAMITSACQHHDHGTVVVHEQQPERVIVEPQPAPLPMVVQEGTNAIFADTHVEWVKGTQIGWP